MRLIVTRPPAQAVAWVRELQALGLDAAALPLIEIAALADTAPLRAAWDRLASCAMVVFVSANAVQQFFAASHGAWPAGVRAGSTGPGTSKALRAAGVAPGAIVEPAVDAPSFDSEALWALLSAEDWTGRCVLVVRGEDGRDWLAETLRERGARVEFVAAYRRLPPRPDAVGCKLLDQALADPAGHLWLFSSSEAVGNLRELACGANWAHGQAIASHPRIAAAAQRAGFGRVVLAAPSATAVAQLAQAWPSIQSVPL